MPPLTNATPVMEQSNDNGTPYQEFKLAYARIWNSTADALDQLPFDKVVVKPIANNESTRSLLKASHANFKLELGIMMENNSTIKLFAHLVKKNQMETLDTSFEIESTPYKLTKIPKLIGANNVVLNEAFEFIKSDKILIALIKVYFLYLGAAVPNDWRDDEKKTGFMNHAKDLVTFMSASGLESTVPRSDLSDSDNLQPETILGASNATVDKTQTPKRSASDAGGVFVRSPSRLPSLSLSNRSSSSLPRLDNPAHHSQASPINSTSTFLNSYKVAQAKETVAMASIHRFNIRLQKIARRKREIEEEERKEYKQLWEHQKTLEEARNLQQELISRLTPQMREFYNTAKGLRK